MDLELKKDQKGISNVVVVMIAIGMALAGGFVAYRTFHNYLSSSTSSVSLQVTYLKALQVTGGEDYASASVKNTGSTLMKDVTVTIIKPDGHGVKMEIGDLNPGETGSGKATRKLDLASGVSYPVEVKAYSPGSKNAAITLTLQVRVS